jgi:hypothetical protein
MLAALLKFICSDHPHLVDLDLVTSEIELVSLNLILLSILHRTMAYALPVQNNLDPLIYPQCCKKHWQKITYIEQGKFIVTNTLDFANRTDAAVVITTHSKTVK